MRAMRDYQRRPITLVIIQEKINLILSCAYISKSRYCFSVADGSAILVCGRAGAQTCVNCIATLQFAV